MIFILALVGIFGFAIALA